jgi:hypothetical protein
VTFPAGHLPDSLVVALLLFGFALAAATWVHSDARAHARKGRPIVSSIASVKLRTPIGWFLACLLLTELVLPVYVDCRPTS